MKKTVAFIVVVALLALLGWRLYLKITTVKGENKRPDLAVAVGVGPVQKATIRDLGFFTGSLIAKSEFIVAPKIAGRLEKITVDIGDSVEHDQLIAELDDDEYVQQVDQAQADLEVSKASVEEAVSALDAAQLELNRAKLLKEKHIIADADFDAIDYKLKAAVAQHKMAGAQVAQKEAALRAAEVRKSYTRISASWEDGKGTWIVGQRLANQGTMLRANDPIVSLLNISELTAVISVAERDYPKLKPDQIVSITTDAFPGKTFAGKVERVAPLVLV